MNKVQKKAMADFFNCKGYVLDFSNREFDQFTKSSIGIALQEHYGFSKGKSLDYFINNEDDELVNKLLNDLLDYYELKGYLENADKKTISTFTKLKKIIKDDTDDVKLILPNIEDINSDYIKKIVSRSYRNINNGDYDSALSISKSLLEAIFCRAIEEKNGVYSKKDDINALFSNVKKLYGMKQNKEIDKRVNELLSGLHKIVSSIDEMRNIAGDSHGYGKNLISIDKHTAILFVNSSLIVAEYFLGIINKKANP